MLNFFVSYFFSMWQSLVVFHLHIKQPATEKTFNPSRGIPLIGLRLQGDIPISPLSPPKHYYVTHCNISAPDIWSWTLQVLHSIMICLIAIVERTKDCVFFYWTSRFHGVPTDRDDKVMFALHCWFWLPETPVGIGGIVWNCYFFLWLFEMERQVEIFQNSCG